MRLLKIVSLFAAVVLIAVVVSMIGRSSAKNPEPTPPPPTLVDSPHPTSVLTGEGPGEPVSTPSASDEDAQAGQDGGSDTHNDEVTPAVTAASQRVSGRFWRAFSERDPKRRHQALKRVTAPDLVKRMRVNDTSRIPVVQPRRSVVLDGSFSSALVVTQAEDGSWWFVDAIQDPISEKWAVQRYESASQQMITDATKLLDHPTPPPSPSPTRR